jgi:hypothetical protein
VCFFISETEGSVKLKRAPFLATAGAAALSGCGGNHALRALPALAPSSSSKVGQGPIRLVPETADPIPDAVLASPLIGEARRFDGSVVPSGWMFAQGQSLPIAIYRELFSVLGTCAGGDGKTTFKLPSPRFGLIVAVAGTLATSQDVITRSARHMTPKDSLGPDARATPLRMPKPPSPALLAAQRLTTSAVRVGRASSVPVSQEMQETFVRAHQDARGGAAARLGSSSQARLEAVVQGLVDGRITSEDAVLELRSSLANDEANAVLDVNDSMIRRFNDRWEGSDRRNAQVDAANFLLSVSLTRDQERAIYRRELSAGR